MYMNTVKYTKEGNFEVIYEDNKISINADDFLKALKSIKKSRKRPNAGICHNITSLGIPGLFDTHNTCILVGNLARDWDKFSGSLKYPVPGTGNLKNPQKAYDTYSNHWDRSLKYGKMRHELIEFLINKVESYINTDYTQSKLMQEAEKLIKKVKKAGYTLTVDILPLEPLAMGNNTMVPSIRKARGNY